MLERLSRAWAITRSVLEGACAAVRRYGAGAGGTRNISGTTRLHVAARGASWRELHGKPAALLFTSGYVANEAAIGTIARLLPGCLILSDAHNHASMIAGIRAAGCEKQIFRHNDLAHLEQLLAAAARERPKLVAFEGVYSMDGDFGPVARDLRARPALRRADLSRRGARGRHVRRARRRGRRARRGRWPRSTWSRARWARRSAAWAATSPAAAALVDAVRSHAPGFIFTTSLPPAVVGGGAGGGAACWAARPAWPCAPRQQERAATLEAAAARGRPAGDAEPVAHRAAAGRRPGALQGRLATCCSSGTASTSSRSTTRPCPRHRAPAHHPRPAHDDALMDQLVDALRGRLGRARDQARCLIQVVYIAQAVRAPWITRSACMR